MARPCCHACLSFILKFLNFLQFFVGVCMILYSAFMLNHWHHHPHVNPPPSYTSSFDVIAGDVIISNIVNGFQFNSHSLPAPWFIYAFMGVGILLCCINCIGHIAAEAINGCCLCFYVVLNTVFILLEVSLVAFIAADRSWEKDLPLDPTGELDSLRNFIEENIDVCKWVGIVVITLQALSLLLAVILRALVSSQRVDVDVDEEYGVRNRPWEPLLNTQSGQTSGSIKGGSSVISSDIWSSRMREKYGLNGSEPRNNSLNSNSSLDTRGKQ